MNSFTYKGKEYRVDFQGFLLDYSEWDEDFAEGMASEADIPDGLTPQHWNVIRFIRKAFNETGECPLFFETCRVNGLRAKDFKGLFPSGYLRGACKLAGITYKDRIVDFFGEKGMVRRQVRPAVAEQGAEEKTYRVDVFGFLIDPSDWDEEFAVNKARELGINHNLTEKHWKVIYCLRENYIKSGTVPKAFDCCEANGIELDEFEGLFPTGYHRGAVKIAGLRVR